MSARRASCDGILAHGPRRRRGNSSAPISSTWAAYHSSQGVGGELHHQRLLLVVVAQDLRQAVELLEDPVDRLNSRQVHPGPGPAVLYRVGEGPQHPIEEAVLALRRVG